MSVRIINADCLTALPQLAAEGVWAHAVVCDPPYHLTSIVKRFGAGNAAAARVGKTGAYARASAGFMGKTWDGGDVAFRPETWAAVMECMLPGAHLVAFGGTRTFHRMAVAIEDAGFEIRDTLAWLHGSGFPKSHNQHGEWEGWGTALKPAFEPIILARKPLVGTVAANVLTHGTGALNIDGCRISLVDGDPLQHGLKGDYARMDSGAVDASWGFKRVDRAAGLGRWPANVIHDGSDEVEAAFASFGERTSGQPCGVKAGGQGHAFGRYNGGIPVTGIGDTGSASRFFFCAKADADDRAGSKHPTVKPGALMRWLVQLVTPPGGLVLDPFAGTGSTGLAADQLGMDAILIEQDGTYAADARRKIERDAGMFASVRTAEDTRDTTPRSLFADAE